MRNSSKAYVAAAFAFIVLAVLYFIWLSPLMADNFVFSREISPGFAQFYKGAEVEGRPLTISGSFRQACEMYFTWCGRFGGNLLVYLLFMLPRGLYCLLAACGFGFYVLLLQICIFGRHWRENLTAGWVLGLAAMLWLGLPSFGEAFFWLSVGGEIALLGQLAMLAPFRMALDGERPFTSRPGSALACSGFLGAGIFVATLDYPTCAALPPTTVACAFWLWRKWRKIPWFYLWGAIGLSLGALLTLLAPGNAERLRLSNDVAVRHFQTLDWPGKLLDGLANLPWGAVLEWLPAILVIWGLVGLKRHYGKDWARRIPIAAWLFFLPAILTHGAYFFSAYPPPRAFATCFAQLLICGCILLVGGQRSARPFWPAHPYLACILALSCSVSMLLEGKKFYDLHQIDLERLEILQTARETGQKSAELPPMPRGQGDRYWVLGKYLNDISVDPDFWVNRGMAMHYGLDSVATRPCAINAWRLPEDANLHMELKDDAIVTRYFPLPENGRPLKLHFYYYGEPALLCRLPVSLGERVFHRLASPGSSYLKNMLIGLLLARADLTQRPDGHGGGLGRSQTLKLISADKFWIVRPGEGTLSLDILPMEKS